MTPPDGLLFDLPESAGPSRRRTSTRVPRPPVATTAGEPWPLNGRINVVLFAGMGGTCAGIEDAGFPVHVAVNHDKVAIAAHRALNPHTLHLQADIFEVCPMDATGGRPVNILWASPDCRDHSVAKGGAPRSPRVRSMAWQVCRWVGVLHRHGLGPNVVYLENVREIRGWGPLIAKRDKATGRVVKLDGTVAAPGERVPVQEQQLVRDPRRVGRSYRAWVRHLRGLGVHYEDRDLCCADFGVPTTRKRLFGIGTLDGIPPRWMAQTHAHRHSAEVRDGLLLPHVPAARIVDWSLPIPSIFDRKRPLVQATMRRIAVGMKRFVIEASHPFLIQLTHSGGPRVHDSREALRTVTTAHRGEVAVIAPQVAVWRGASAGSDVAAALPTLTANSYHKRPGGALPLGLVAASLVQTGYGERPGQAPRCLDVEDPIGTQVAGGAKHAVVAAYLAEHRGRSVGQASEEALGAQTQVPHHAVVGAWMVKNSTDVVGLPADDPVSTVVTTVGPQAVGAAFMVHQRGTGTATSPDDSVRTLSTGGGRGGDHVGLVAAYMTEYYGTGGQHQDVAGSLNTLSTRDRFGLTAAEISETLTPEQMTRAREVADFLRAFDAWDGGEVVTVGPWIVVDIGMRMLRPEEAAAAHELRLPSEIQADGITRPLTKTEAMRLVGNSVPKRMAQLLVQANARHALATAQAGAA